jgi:hypothetical protein
MINKRHARLLSDPPSDGTDQLMFLVGADQETGGEPLAARLPGLDRRLLQAQAITEAAALALLLMESHVTKIEFGLVPIADQQWKLRPPGQFPCSIQPLLILLVRVNVRVEKEPDQIMVMLQQFPGRPGSTGAAAGVQQQPH